MGVQWRITEVWIWLFYSIVSRGDPDNIHMIRYQTKLEAERYAHMAPGFALTFGALI